jgi:hypothetical protein
MFETPVSVSNLVSHLRPWYIWKEEFKILLLVTQKYLESGFERWLHLLPDIPPPHETAATYAIG